MHYFEGKYCGTVYFFIYQKLYKTVFVMKCFFLSRITAQKDLFFKITEKDSFHPGQLRTRYIILVPWQQNIVTVGILYELLN